MVEVEGRRDERGFALFAGAVLVDAYSLSFLCRPSMSHDAADLEAEALRDLRHRFAAVDKLPTYIEIELLDRHLEDSSKDFVILWQFANHEVWARFGAHKQRRRYIGAAAVSLLDTDLSSGIVYRELKGQFVLSPSRCCRNRGASTFRARSARREAS